MLVHVLVMEVLRVKDYHFCLIAGENIDWMAATYLNVCLSYSNCWFMLFHTLTSV